MKTITLLAAAALLVGCASTQPTFNATEAFDREMMALDSGVKAGQISELQLAERAAELSRAYFPTDYHFHSLRDYKVLLAQRLARGDIQKDEFDYLWSEKRNSFMASRQQMNRQIAADDDARRAAAAAFMLQRTGNAIRSAYPAPAPVTNCVTSPMGGSLTTTCY